MSAHNFEHFYRFTSTEIKNTEIFSQFFSFVFLNMCVCECLQLLCVYSGVYKTQAKMLT